MNTDLSKQEYLKRYLEQGKEGKKKKSKKLKPSNSRVSRIKILDENIDLKSIKFGEKDLDGEEDEPVVAEIIDERPLEVKVKEMYDASRWKKVGSDEADARRIDEDDAISKICSKTQDDLVSTENFLSSVKKTTKNKSRHDSDSDISPPRGNNERNSDSDIPSSHSHRKAVKVRNNADKVSKEKRILQRKSRHDSDSDISVSRKHVTGGLNDSDSDISVERSHTAKENNIINSHKFHEKRIPQRKNRHDSDSDISPPRKQHSNKRRENKNSDSDISPPRVKRKDNKYPHEPANDDYDTEERIKHFDSKKSEKAYDRKSKDSKKDHSSGSDFSPSLAKSTRNMEKSVSKGGRNRPEKTLLGLKAGLQNASTLRKETQELREREKKHINKLSDNLSGRNVETIVRDRQTGMKRDLQAERLVKDAEEKKNVDHQKKYMEWGKGVQQTENRQKKLEDDLYEMTKPLARYCDDEDLEEQLKSVIHEEDPMAEYMRKKKRKNEPAVPIYRGPAPPPNRFGIQPGYRWDGVDRSNGFEKKFFEKNNASKASQEEAYLWSVQDM
ncbi:BUD13 homolog [Uloborus diversus]|uniref:BUD13 homolog n=1 Tax=Uloborus diversus TaxID=327109 RepID=UPI0024092913|nr:BUD13 homolog [Uloborus diversus]